MTEEEMAEEYIKSNNLEWEIECHRTSAIGEVKHAYLAGLKAGRPKWHEVADGILPDNFRYVWTDVGAGYYDNEEWWDAFGRLHGVTAWCEPAYTEML